MKNEDLFRALGDVGDDLIHMAETQRFRNPWKNWVSMAAAVAVVISLGALALPYFPSGCSASKSAAPESAAEVPKYTFTADMMDQEKPEIIEEESPTEAVPENEMALTAPSPGASEDSWMNMNSAAGSSAQTDVIQITVCSTVYYLQPNLVDGEKTPEKLGLHIGNVESADNEAYLDCPVYEVLGTTWYSNHAVDGQSVPSEILVEGPNGWIAGFTGNEKTVSRYTAADVQAAIDREDGEWIIRTFVQPLQAQEIYLLYEGACEDSETLNRLFLASLYLNTGTAIDIAWAQDDESLLVHPRDVEQRLEKFLDEFAYDPAETEAYDPETGMLRFTPEERYRYAEGLYLKFAGLENDLLYLHVGLPETDDLYDEVHYMIRFDTDSWRYLSIETPG